MSEPLDFTPVEPGSVDWNWLEDMIVRLGPKAVLDAVERINDGLERDRDEAVPKPEGP